MENMLSKHSLVQKTSVEFQRETEMRRGGLNTLYKLLLSVSFETNSELIGIKSNAFPFSFLLSNQSSFLVMFNFFVHLAVHLLLSCEPDSELTRIESSTCSDCWSLKSAPAASSLACYEKGTFFCIDTSHSFSSSLEPVYLVLNPQVHIACMWARSVRTKPIVKYIRMQNKKVKIPFATSHPNSDRVRAQIADGGKSDASVFRLSLQAFTDRRLGVLMADG
jgi:hypothetical protein